MKQIELRTDKLIHGGQALGHANGKACFIWNALPGETVRAWVINEKDNYLEANAAEILTPSPDRVAPVESHYLACAPWQILSWKAENEWKQTIALETYTRLGKLKDAVIDPILFNPDGQMGYRNKIEYSFLIRKESGQPQTPSFGIHQRGNQDLYPVQTCALARPEINETALAVLEWLKTWDIPLKKLKRLVVKAGSGTESAVGSNRTNDTTVFSSGKGETLAVLYITDRCPMPSGMSPLLKNTAGLVICLQSKEPGGVQAGHALWQAGETTVTTRLLDTPLQYGPLSFFQVNPPVFEMALRDIATFLSPTDKVVDYYAGVGAISLPLAKHYASAILVESSGESADYAQKNITALGLTHCRLQKSSAENALRWIESDSVLILDPPRAGMGEKLLRKILQKKPTRLIYLSCDIATHARDIAKLTESYTLRSLKLYNFFPRTPHIEALAVLDRKAPLSEVKS